MEASCELAALISMDCMRIVPRTEKLEREEVLVSVEDIPEKLIDLHEYLNEPIPSFIRLKNGYLKVEEETSRYSVISRFLPPCDGIIFHKLIATAYAPTSSTGPEIQGDGSRDKIHKDKQKDFSQSKLVELLFACDEEDEGAIKDLLKANPKLLVEKCNEVDGGNALHFCASYNKRKALRQLLSWGDWSGGTSWSTNVVGSTVLQFMKDTELRRICEKFWTRSSDQPTENDQLGRSKLAKGIASILLNPFFDTPITIGIFGVWGSGKTSLMLQVELSLATTVVQRALLPHTCIIEVFPGALIPRHTKKGRMLHEFVKELVIPNFEPTQKENGQAWWQIILAKFFGGIFKAKKETKINEQDLWKYFFEESRSRWKSLWKHLGVVDFKTLVTNELSEATGKTVAAENKEYQLPQIPAVLTVSYNAWLYEGKMEAWAGLASTLMREMESYMNTAQYLRSCWNYAWKVNKGFLISNLFLPVITVVLLSGVIAWIAWKVITSMPSTARAKYELGVLPVGVLVVTGTVLQRIITTIKPISESIIGQSSYTTKHEAGQGYQQTIIQDIRFMKSQICEEPSTMWRILGCFVGPLFGRDCNTFEGKTLKKLMPSKSNLRIVVFIDDIDRCSDESYVVQMLSGVNLILSSCDINVVLCMEKATIKRILGNKLHHPLGKDNQQKPNVEADEHLAEEFLEKIIQLPIDLSDPSPKDMNYFMDRQTGKQQSKRSDESSTQLSLENQPIISKDYLANARGVVVNVGDLQGSKFSLCKPRKRSPNVVNEGEHQSKAGKYSCKFAVDFPVLIARYNDSERETFKHLLEFREIHHPRQWKRILNYHRLAWNILSRTQEARGLNAWQRQLVMWVGVCWIWPKIMNQMIMNWSNICKKFGKEKMQSSSKIKKSSAELEEELPSLREVLEYLKCMPQKGDEKKEDFLLLDFNGCQKALEGDFDVSMKAMLTFQTYRFQCDGKFLEHPFEILKSPPNNDSTNGDQDQES